MDELAAYALDRCEYQCLLSFCHTPESCVVYGLYDARNGDIFYVGKTLNMPRRFREHLRNHPYIQAMLERGAFPLPIVLCEFTTWCDVYSRRIENEIAHQLREQGHSAFGDEAGSTPFFFRYNFYAIAEEQAHRIALLREMWHSV